MVTGDSNTLVYFGSDARGPAMPYAMPLAGGPGRMLAQAALPRDFPSSKLVVPQQVIFKAEDGVQVHGQLFLPHFLLHRHWLRAYAAASDFFDRHLRR